MTSAQTPAAPLRVALYTRVSTDIQANAEEGSLDTQAARLRREVQARSERHGPHQVVEVFREEGASGKNLERPQLRRLIRAVEAGQLDLVIVTRIDRLSRSLLDFVYLHETFQKRGVRFVSLQENFDTTTPVGEAMLKLVLIFAELERKQTAERTKVAMHSRAERGIWNGGHPVLGYESDGSGKLTVVEVEAAVVRAVFDQIAELRSVRKVAVWLNSQGHRQKRYVSRRRGDTGEREFTPAVVAHLLRDRRYLGEVPFSGEWFQGQHQALVDAGLFRRAGEIVGANYQGGRRSTPASDHFFLLTGKVRCGACEGEYALTTASGRGRRGVKYSYYRCVSTTKKAAPKCSVGLVRADKLESAVLAVVREAARRPQIVEKAIAETERILREELAPARDRLDALRKDREGVKRELDAGFSAITAAGLGDVGYFAERMRDLDGRRQQLDDAIIEEDARLSQIESQHLDLDVAVQALRGFDTAYAFLTPAERKEFLDLMLDQIIVFPDRIEVGLYQGQKAAVPLAERVAARQGGTTKEGKGARGTADAAATDAPVTASTPEGEGGDQGFVWCVDWLPDLDSNQGHMD